MGSYAGAMSPAQFISSSYRAYAIDFENIGTKDLNNMPNAIGSVANYFYKHGWQGKQPIARAAKIVTNNNYVEYIDRDLASPKPKHSLQQLKNIYLLIQLIQNYPISFLVLCRNLAFVILALKPPEPKRTVLIFIVFGSRTYTL